MQGLGYKCDNCGRGVYVDEPPEGEMPIPPAGWLGMSIVPEKGQEWEEPQHYCTWQCIQEKSIQMLNPPTPLLPDDDDEEAGLLAYAEHDG